MATLESCVFIGCGKYAAVLAVDHTILAGNTSMWILESEEATSDRLKRHFEVIATSEIITYRNHVHIHVDLLVDL